MTNPQAATLPQLTKHLRLLKSVGFEHVEIRYDANRCPYIVGMTPHASDDGLGDLIDAA